MSFYFGTFGKEGEHVVYVATAHYFCLLNPRHDLWKHSDKVRWGISAESSKQLSLALLADALDSDHLACKLYMAFNEEMAQALLPDRPWCTTSNAIRDWCIDRLSGGESSTFATLLNVGRGSNG